LTDAHIGIDALNLGDFFDHYPDDVTPLNGPTRVNGHTFALVGDYTDDFAKGARVTIGSFETFVTAATFSSGVTTVTTAKMSSADDTLPVSLSGLMIGTPTAPTIDFQFTGLDKLLSFDNINFSSNPSSTRSSC